ncbi:MAG: tocopherol cyclase family protein, partial [Bacteroidota bacterium]|nr:tocopherol cyclase family protein [Bacteroidota bacterium]
MKETISQNSRFLFRIWNKLNKVYHPEVFQGSLRKKHYFEGWYFKHVTTDPSRTIIFIPGISLAWNDPHSFIQIMNSETGRTNYIRYRPDEFRWDEKRFFIQVGSSEFTSSYIKLDIENEAIITKGEIEYRNLVKYPKSLFSPGIMGWYTFVPFMECNHGIVSVTHDLSGSISIDGKEIKLEGGKGYIEKDWGTSFPESWIWIQSNNFDEHDTSFTLSVAKIPWLGSFFIGFIVFLYLGKRFYMFSTYNRSRISEL